MDRKLIAFTFDDVPSYAENDGNPTTTVIDTLTEFGGKGTMFLIGDNLKTNGRRLVDAALERGFELGNHTQSHKCFYDLSKEETVEDIMTLQESVRNEFGIDMKYLRPGYLSINDYARDFAEEHRMPIIFGSVGAAYLADWAPATTAESVKRICLENAYPGQIVLMHGYSMSTQKAFHDICRELSEQGYGFVTLTELFDAYGVTDFPYRRPIADAQLTEI